MSKYKIFSFASLLFWLLLIIILSSQNGEETALTSSSISEFIAKFFYLEPNKYNINEIDMVIRKVAHFVLFFGLGFSATQVIFVLFENKMQLKYLIIISALSSIFIAFLDEWRKQFIPGRHFDFYESLINISAAFLGVAIMYMIYRALKKHLP